MAGFTVERSISVSAPAQEVYALVDDFHQWRRWSPWEDVDPDLQRTYTGPDRGVGAHYAWSGNRKAGAGSMEIVRSTPEGVDITLRFLKPIKATNQTSFVLAGSGPETRVTWRMSGEQRGLVMGLFGRFMNMDKMIGPDFEKGLARLKAVAEEGPA